MKKNLPLHHIDTSIFLAAFSNREKYSFVCKRYLNKVSVNYHAAVSFSVLSELFLKLIKTISEDDKISFFLWFARFVKRKEVKLYPSNFSTYSRIENLRTSNFRLDPLDALHLATALENGATTFVTIDTKLGKQVNGLRIQHPENL